jgi:hypothetical protein
MFFMSGKAESFGFMSNVSDIRDFIQGESPIESQTGARHEIGDTNHPYHQQIDRPEPP